MPDVSHFDPPFLFALRMLGCGPGWIRTSDNPVFSGNPTGRPLRASRWQGRCSATELRDHDVIEMPSGCGFRSRSPPWWLCQGNPRPTALAGEARRGQAGRQNDAQMVISRWGGKGSERFWGFCRQECFLRTGDLHGFQRALFLRLVRPTSAVDEGGDGAGEPPH